MLNFHIILLYIIFSILSFDIYASYSILFFTQNLIITIYAAAFNICSIAYLLLKMILLSMFHSMLNTSRIFFQNDSVTFNQYSIDFSYKADSSIPDGINNKIIKYLYLNNLYSYFILYY